MPRSRVALSDAMLVAVMEREMVDGPLSPHETMVTVLNSPEFQALRSYLGLRRHTPRFHSDLPAIVRDWATES